ncbi:protein singed wings 2 isoform X1 [Pieris brassicae]|uniref:protein singed wings 2 isoform X1 n=2 Tax=Pieris brassicae TaxID=7116 RepID=UPI001E65FE81|nr:protein singed wings 2 isoform X1 [Pieris brassicae]XP_045516867.1 protein singed wings 2 isoform X1 [Pieris brassicae]XP_045516868.1 protein singed wings 2 isoform X1 [Pieris brassicae]
MRFLVLRILFTTLMIGIAASNTHLKQNHTALSNRACTLIGTNKALCFKSGHELVCTRGFTNDWLTGVRHEIISLKIVDWPGSCFNVNRLEYHYPNLREFGFFNSTLITKLKGRFTAVSRIEKFSVHGLTSLWEVPAEMVSQMSQLKVIDLRSNVLRHLKAPLLQGPSKLEKVYLSDNKWDCSDGGLDWLAMEHENGTIRRMIVDYYLLVCHQQLYRGKPLHKVMDIIKMVRETCPQPCLCAMTHVVTDRAGGIIPLITVGCANKKLTVPPTTLPPSATTLRLEGNKLNTIRSLVQEPQYRKLMDLYLDNNSIPAVKELEGSEWFTTFRVLSLRGNFLKQIPVYAFDKAFQANNNIMGVFLGQNPWRCDCHFIPRFQALLLKYKRIIRDLSDIRCSKSEDKTISQVQISTMPLGNVCGRTETKLMPISSINIVNLVLSFLIFIIIGRFLYDWHHFRTTGKLPWLSSILP